MEDARGCLSFIEREGLSIVGDKKSSMRNRESTVAMEEPPALEQSVDQSILKITGFLPTTVAVAAAFAAFSLMLPVIPLAVIAGGGSDTLAGASTAVFMAVTVLTQLCTNAALLRFGYRKVMVLAALLLGVPALWYVIAMDPVSVLVVAGVRGVGFGSLCVAQYALVGQLVPAGKLGKASGVLGLFVGASQMVCLPLGLLLIDAGVGFNAVFVAGGLAALIAGIMAFAIPNLDPAQPAAAEVWTEEDDARELAKNRRNTMANTARNQIVKVAKRTVPARTRRQIRKRIHRRPRTKGLVVTVVPAVALASVSMGYGAVSSFLPASVRETDPIYGATIAGIMLSVVGGAQMIFRYISGTLADRLQRPGAMMIPGLFLSSIGLVGIVVVLTQGWSALWLIFTALFFGAGFGLVQNEALLEMFLRVPRGKIAQASTVWNASFDTGTGIGSIILGVVATSHGYSAAFAGGAVLVSIGLATELGDRILRKRGKRQALAQAAA
ncbi:Major facilitator superfamily protein [Corynebacterium ulcerans]|uniref:Major facilitator superfamily protein n=1 Tax=Corynebacterium ulcerans TaxID=65058 RepID=A0ABD7MQP0_CORUL|nr:Major facilitator superfamily protein [Corynebacterium ulcerans]SQG50202.1 Major facilitator superfamily protein [Corynebacterium ulcerans]SQH01621.1 Major facilitator superfamily protein [Corynebacterium ulcerans]